ncbi:N-acetylornithine carbamoyltransferase [uncultured Imperialibacter sp.]|uniref:N-acetylornithine carbamoyltransferase n=1 Tax=uncultured Imperialibacter sp. TaxID=1672639 RepID=UPI0030DB12B7|tara:strand:- start:8219 stop:9169 length:951 start_codon:yes stop_codon:yes gene_type:complete
MNNFLSLDDLSDPMAFAREAIELKKNPLADMHLGRGKMLGMVFFNSSLRTRMSVQKAAFNLGIQTMVLNVGGDLWTLETQDGAVMNGKAAEHIKEAVPVMANYCDILAVRCFPGLENRDIDSEEKILTAFATKSGKPVVNMESATLHPLQSLADLITILEHQPKPRPKVVLSWAPHIKPLPHCVSNSFSQWMNKADVEFVITHPKGLELGTKYTKGAVIEFDQKKAFEGADFIYAKNWSSYNDYGKFMDAPEWIIDAEKMAWTNQARFMHCLPVRRNVEVADDVLDGPHSIVVKQAANREFATQRVLKELLKELKH